MDKKFEILCDEHHYTADEAARALDFVEALLESYGVDEALSGLRAVRSDLHITTPADREAWKMLHDCLDAAKYFDNVFGRGGAFSSPFGTAIKGIEHRQLVHDFDVFTRLAKAAGQPIKWEPDVNNRSEYGRHSFVFKGMEFAVYKRQGGED